MSTPEVSVVVASSAGGHTIDELFGALAGQVGAPPFEVVLVANRASYDADAVVARWSGRLDLVLLRADERPGISYARNLGIVRAHAAKLIFLDDDDVPEPDYLAVMARALDEHEAVASRIELQQLNEGWRADVRRVAQAEGTSGAPLDFGYGATLGFRRTLCDAVGGFDERLDGVAGEDVEWCLRLRRTGRTLVYVPEAVLHYRLRTGYRDLWRQGVRYGRAGQLVTPQWRGWWQWLRTVPGPVRLLLVGPGKGLRRRGAFLLGRRVGKMLERRSGRAPAAGQDLAEPGS